MFCVWFVSVVQLRPTENEEDTKNADQCFLHCVQVIGLAKQIPILQEQN